MEGVAVLGPAVATGLDSEDISAANAGIEDANAEAPTSMPADFNRARREGSFKPLVLDELIGSSV